jgi:GT2 family glycosyltransferase
VDSPSVFVVVLNWNLKDETIDCVTSVLAGNYVRQRIVIVDNGSEDGSVSAFERQFGESVALILNRENLGFAGGMNSGIRYALDHSADWVLLLNNDTVVAPDMLEALLSAASQPELGILTPAIFYYDQPGLVWRLGDRRSPWLPMPLKISASEAKSQAILPVDYVTGCAMLVKRQVLETVGLLDEQFFMYYEDADFCRRGIEAGFKVACVPWAKVWHRVSLSANKVLSATSYRSAKSRVMFYRRYRHGPSRLLTDVYLLLGMAFNISRLFLYGNRHLISPYLSGFFEGWNQSRLINSNIARKKEDF